MITATYVAIRSALALSLAVQPTGPSPVAQSQQPITAAAQTPALSLAAQPPDLSPAAPTPDIVLIDDDPLVASAWALQANREGKRLTVYQDAASFWQEAGGIPNFTPIFVDYQLAHGARGDLLSKDIAEAGFKRLFLATGYAPLIETKMPWLEGVVGKEPPF